MSLPQPTRSPPVARRDETCADEYAWLRDSRWQRVLRDPGVLDPEIRTHLEAENAYAAAFFEPLQPLIATLKGEMRARLKEDDVSVPVPDGPFNYAQRYQAGAQHPLYVRYDAAGAEQVLLDAQAAASGHGFFRIGRVRQSRDHRRLAFSVDTSGGERYALHVRDLASGLAIGTSADDVHGFGDLVWATDGSLFYTRLDEHQRPRWVYRRFPGSSRPDQSVYEEGDPAFYLSISASDSGRFLVIEASDHAMTTEVRLLDLARPDDPSRLIAARDPGVSYSVADHGETLFVLTNADGAEDFKIATAALSSPDRAGWRDLVAHRAGVYLRQMTVFARHLVRYEREDALPRLVVRELVSGQEHAIAFDEEAYELGLVDDMPFAGSTLRFTYASPATSQRIFDYDMATRVRLLRKEQEVPSGHDPSRYVVRRLSAPTPDGEQVPITILHRRDQALDGTSPLLLYGYGAYGLTVPTGFNSNRLSLVDRGVVFAHAHIRGGMDRGVRWYRAGKLEHKTNTFGDFVAVAEFLAAQRLIDRRRIAIQGGSAGGMLIGAVLNRRPDLFAAALAEVPFVDVLNTMLDDSLPLTPPEWSEWGDPIRDPRARARLAGYSPYDNVRAQPYPPILAMAGVSDPRVTYWEPAKWVAKLRALKTDANPVVLKMNMGAGHGGASGRFDRLDEVAYGYAFVLAALDKV
ncbi:MAG: S9 family peptidase [Alphaproteobacteria bacterium]|nr:S9 family peptidase [Alphaproteobacteria bacterium]